MRRTIEEEIEQTQPISREVSAFLNLQRTTNVLLQSFQRLLKPARLTPTQYNALRILRGAHPAGLPCRQIGARLVTPVPDITRLVERLVRSGWAARERSDHDRRVVVVSLTPTGLELLKALDPVVGEWLTRHLGKLNSQASEDLTRHLETLREGL